MTDIKGPTAVDGEAYLSSEDLLRLELHQSKMECARLTHEVMRYRIIESRRLEDARLANAAIDAARLQADYVEFKKRLGAAYAVDISKITYDDQTGRIFVDGAPLMMPATEEHDHGAEETVSTS